MSYTQVETNKSDSLGRPYLYAEIDENGVEQCYKRADGLFDVPIDLPDEDLLTLALEAHRREITLNDLLVEIIKEQIDRSTNDTSKAS
jgi:predicted HicB family RNase H-like nuclease